MCKRNLLQHMFLSLKLEPVYAINSGLVTWYSVAYETVLNSQNATEKTNNTEKRESYCSNQNLNVDFDQSCTLMLQVTLKTRV